MRVLHVAVILAVAVGWGIAAWFLLDTVVPGDLTLPAVDVDEVFGPDLVEEAERYERFLFADWVFRAGYRRFEWKCNALNRASRRAAERFGFSFEGVFRNHMVVKGRNRDTAWFAMTDGDWAYLKPAWEAWLDPGNFDEAGRQRRGLGELTAGCRVASDPGA